MINKHDTFSHRESEPEKSILYIVGTPIGNLDDISNRTTNILKNVSSIFCEDTRNTMKLMNALKISNKLISFHEHNSSKRIPLALSKLKNGESLALVSDAGMPLISDPGETLVKEIKNNNYEVICIPGPCAALNALISSGMNTDQFTFYGFVPKANKERTKLLNKINNNQLTSIIFESPKRLSKLFQDLKDICGGERKVSVSKEMTKRYEMHYGEDLNELIERFKDIEPKGEFTIVVSGNKGIKDLAPDFEFIKEDLIYLIKLGLSHSAASSFLSKKYRLPKKTIYNLIIEKTTT